MPAWRRCDLLYAVLLSRTEHSPLWTLGFYGCHGVVVFRIADEIVAGAVGVGKHAQTGTCTFWYFGLLETGGDPPFHMALRIGGAGDDEGFQTLLSGNAVNKRIASETRCSGFQAGTRMAERVHEVLPSNACLGEKQRNHHELAHVD